jgi:hypothetical protein
VTVTIHRHQAQPLTIPQIDERLRTLWECVATYREGGEPGISPLDALEVIDELLDLRLELAAPRAWRDAA